MRKTLLLKLIAILLICVLGMQSAALANPTGNTSSLAYGKEIEIEELRTTDSKTYQLSDGSFKYVGYAEEVHYKDSNGKFADIDNSITGSAEKDGYTYTNKANSWRAYFSSQLSVSKAVLLEAGDYSLSFNMPSASQQNAAKKTADMTEHADSYYEDKKSDNRAVIYQEALTGVDVVYTVRTSGLKEDIVLKNAAVPHSFEFVLTADGLTAVKRDGTVYFQDREGNDIFHIGSLYMIDSNGKYSESVTCSIQQVKNGYSLVISASEEFLNAADTVYPVIIDPSIMITGTSNTFDTCVDEQYPSSNYYASENLWTGGATGTNTMRTYIKFTMPSNITAAQVTSATLRIKKREHKTPTIKAYRVTSSWSSSSVTWNNKPSYTTANGTGTITLDTGSWYKLDTTTIVKYWLAGTYSNYGFLLKEPSETSSSQKTKFYSSDAPSPNKPELEVVYSLETGPTPTPYYPPAPPSQPSDFDHVSYYAGEGGEDTWLGGLFSAPKEKDATQFSSIMEGKFNCTKSALWYKAQRNYIKAYNGSNQADFLYWSGHGLSEGNLSYWDGNNYQGYSPGFIGYEQVGSTIQSWNSTGYYSNTEWNADLKWAILAVCNQFTNYSTRQAWGRTLLGSHNRAHIVMGYAQTAPVGPTDYQILDKWAEYLENDHPILNAWILANIDKGKTYAAAIAHYSNRNDKIDNVSSNSSPQSYPNLKYYCGSITGNSLSPQNNHDETGDFPLYANVYSCEGGNINVKDLDLLALEKNFDSYSKDAEGATTDNNIVLRCDEQNGRITIYNKSIRIDNSPMRITAVEGLEKAINVLTRSGLMEHNEEWSVDYAQVIEITEENLDVNNKSLNQTNSSPTTIGYVYVIPRIIDDIPVFSSADSIKVYVCKGGVSIIEKTKNTIKIDGERAKLLESDVVFEQLPVEQKKILLKAGFDVKVDLVYFLIDNEKKVFVPAWMYQSGNETFVYNAITGELLHQ